MNDLFDGRTALVKKARAIDLFDDIDDVELGRAAMSRNLIILPHVPDDRFLLQGEEYRSLVVLLEGTCAAEMCDPSGKVLQIETFSGVHSIGVGLLFGASHLLPVSVVARTASTTMRIRKEYLRTLIGESGSARDWFLREISDRVTLLTRRMRFLSLNSIREKVASYLLDLTADGADECNLSMSVEELSRYFGVARPSLSHAFGELAREGAIEKHGQRITIRNRLALQRILDKEHL